MSWKDSTLRSILNLKCPYCGKGDFFIAHPYNLRRIGDNHDYCPNCKGRLNREPGFYLGSMLIANAIGLLMGTALWVAFMYLTPDMPTLWVVLGATVPMLLAWPWIYAISKVIWAHIFLDFDNPTGLERKQEGASSRL